MATAVANARNIVAFVKKETSPGTLVFPAATDAIILADYGDLNQQPTFSDSPEIVPNSRDVVQQFQDQVGAGKWSFPIIVRPSGTLGTAPMGDVLYECLMAKKTVNTGASVVYGQQMDKPSFSLWIQRDHTIFFARGCTVDKGSLKATAKGPAQIDFSGGCMQVSRAGTDSLASAALVSATSLVVTDAKKFSKGARIQNVTKGDNNTSTGYEVTDVNYSTNTLTIGTGLSQAWAQNDVIAGYLPTASVPTSYPVECKDVTVSIGGTPYAYKTVALDIGDPTKFLEDEITGTGYPEQYVADTRSIDFSAEGYFRASDASKIQDGYNNSQQAVVITVGATSTKKLVISLPKVQMQVPEIKVSAPTIGLSVKGKALANTTAGENSATLTFQ